MDALLEAIGKLFLVFKDPVNVILLLLCSVSVFGNYKMVMFFLSNYKESVANDLRNAQALEGVQKTLEKVLSNGKP